VPDKSLDLPEGLEDALRKLILNTTSDDETTVLQADLQYAEDALDVQTSMNELLKKEIVALKNNTEIKIKVVRYAIGSLVIVPLFCFVLFVLGSVRIPTLQNPLIEVDIPAYAQAALIITPILFFAAVIRQLIASFASEKTSNNSDDGMTDIIKVIRETLKQSGQS